MSKRPAKKSLGQTIFETHEMRAEAAAGHFTIEAHAGTAGGTHSFTIEAIRTKHRFRRATMKLQQKVERSLESFIRREATDWSPDLPEAERTAINKRVKALIVELRKGEGDPELRKMVLTFDEVLEAPKEMRENYEKDMIALAKTLPVHAWVEDVRGAGTLGLATIIAEAGDLSNYATPAKLWKRLGFAPYEGHAGSTWKRATWRPHALSAEEWMENPFSGERYALMHQIAVWLKNAQWIGAAKTDDGVGKPNGPYGEIYARRRAHTAQTHSDWTPMHSHMDALRVMMKKYLKDLWGAWNTVSHHSVDSREYHADGAALGPLDHVTHRADAGSRKHSAGQPRGVSQVVSASSAASDRLGVDIQALGVGGRNS